MKKIALALITLLLITCVGCTSKTDANSTPEPTPAVITPTPTPESTPTPEPASTPELPPVEVTYDMQYDTNKDGVIDKAEWEAWVAAHPEDTNKDMVISAEEKGEVATPVETPKPVEAPKPVETPPPVVETPTPEPTTPPYESSDEDLQQAFENTQKIAEETGGKAVGPGLIEVSEEDGWVT